MAVTNKFNFLLLNGSDAAGHNTINNLINSIESSLEGVSTGLATGADTPGALTTGQVLRWNGSTYAAALVNAASLDTSAVTESKIADGAVTSAKILDGTITTTDLAFDPATQAELDAHAADTTSVHGITDTSALALKSGNTYTGTHNFSGATLTGTASSASNLTGGAGGSVPYQSGAGTTAMLANGSNGQVLTSSGGTAAPTWQNINSGSVTLAGDVTGAANANTIANGAVTSAKILDGTITGDDIASNTITYNKLNTNAKRYDVTTGGAGLVFTSSGSLSTTSASTNPTQQPLVVVDSSAGAVTLTLPTTGFTTIPGATITIAQTAGSNPVTIQPGASVFINGSNSNTYTLGGLYSVVTLILFGVGNTWIITGDYI